MTASATDFRLLFITDRTLSSMPLPALVRTACDAGVRAVQLREKDLSGAALLALAAELREVTVVRQASLYVNDRVDVALSVGADGVHCPESGFPPRDARSLLGPGKAVGASTHSLEGARQAFRDGSDFVTFGPVFATPSKSAWGEPQGLDALERVCGAVDRPVFAVGGVTPERAAACLQSGAAGVAVISAIMAARDVARVVDAFASALGTL